MYASSINATTFTLKQGANATPNGVLQQTVVPLVYPLLTLVQQEIMSFLQKQPSITIQHL